MRNTILAILASVIVVAGANGVVATVGDGDMSFNKTKKSFGGGTFKSGVHVVICPTRKKRVDGTPVPWTHSFTVPEGRIWIVWCHREGYLKIWKF